MMKELRGLDLKRAQLVPSSVFAGPDEVLQHDGLSAAQKLAILRRWEFDARRVAGFAGAAAGTRDAGLLLRVRRAIQTLGGTAQAGRREKAGGPLVLDVVQGPSMVGPTTLMSDEAGAAEDRVERTSRIPKLI